MAVRRTALRRETARPRRDWLPILQGAVIVLAGCLVYANSLTGPFLFDDQGAILENPTIRQLWSVTDVLRPPPQSPMSGRPIANLSLAINFAVGQFRVEGYHVWNVVMHLLVALTLFGLLRRLLAWLPTGEHGDLPGEHIAAVCAAIWVVHPLNSEAVNYLTQRTESMAALFCLLTLYAAIRADDARHRTAWSAGAALVHVCGIATKESAAVAPLLVMLFDRTHSYPSWRGAIRERWRLYAALSAGWLVLALLARDTPFFRADGFETPVTPWTYLLNQASIIPRYLHLSVWPLDLLFDYGVATALTLRDVWPSALLLVSLVASTLVLLVRAPRIGFWCGWFFLTLAPASSVIPIPTEVGAERRMYVPLMALIVLVVMGLWRVGRRLESAFSGRSPDWPRPAVRRWAAALIMALVLIGLSAKTIQRNVEYRSALTIWQSVVDRRPHPRGHTALALQLRNAGRHDEAVAHLRLAAPHWPDARLALGSALRERGEFAPAIIQLREFIRLRPRSRELATARTELASALAGAGDVSAAIGELRAVAALAPQSAGARVALADLLFSTRDFVGAAREYRAYLRVQPGTLAVMLRLGLALTGSGDRRAAIDVLRRALAVEPRSIIARRALLEALRQEQRFAELEVEARLTLELDPNDPHAHNLLGIALASRQRFDDAAEAFGEAVRLDPGLDEARANLDRVTTLRGRQMPPERRR